MKSYTQLKLALYFCQKESTELPHARSYGPAPDHGPVQWTLPATCKSGRRSTTLHSKTWVSVATREQFSHPRV